MTLMMPFRVLLVSGVYPPAVGGPSLQTKQIADRLMAQGVTVQVATYGDPDSSGTVDGIPLTYLDASPHPHWRGKLGRNLRVLAELDRLVCQFQPHVIHMQTAAGNLALMTGIVARRHGIPSLLKYTADLVAQKSRLSDFSPDRDPPRSLRRRLHQCCTDRFQRSLFQLYTGVWATTAVFQSRLVNDYRVSPGKAFWLPNFIDLEPFEAVARRRDEDRSDLPDEFKLLTVARLFPVKGLDVYLQALAQLQDLPLRARIVGSGSDEYQQQLLTLAAELGIRDRVEFTGAIAPEDISAAYETADMFVLPSRHEPFGIVLIEAMAAGVPIVATEVDGIPQVVDAGVSAQLVPPDDARRLAAAIRTLYQSADQRRAFAEAGRTRSRRFSLDQGVHSLTIIYHTLASSQKRADSPPLTSGDRVTCPDAASSECLTPSSPPLKP